MRRRSKAIAVVMEESMESQYINVYDFIVQMGHVS